MAPIYVIHLLSDSESQVTSGPVGTFTNCMDVELRMDDDFQGPI